jgi:hypothetical protein
MARHRSNVNRSAAADPSSLAGWMYADLLLALTIVFLATISFVPQFTNLISKQGGTVVKSNLTVPNFSSAGFNEGLAFTTSSFDKVKLVQSINSYAELKNLGKNFQIIYAQIIGGYDPIHQSSDVGTLNALAFSIKLQSLKLPYFSNLNTNVSASTLVPPGFVKVEFTIMPNG